MTEWTSTPGHFGMLPGGNPLTVWKNPPLRAPAHVPIVTSATWLHSPGVCDLVVAQGHQSARLPVVDVAWFVRFDLR